uniref:Uncharacterized protein n=1 Tax=Branchiostoma floridae TaxID=7739 RepID=C3YB65_BRAFL|eukprot:XP_002606517.1 hypothetical protein BRAFLDRAFT_91899 [Branchiostoma floridae]
MTSFSLSKSDQAQEANLLTPCTPAMTSIAHVGSLVQALDEDGVWSNGTVNTVHSDGTVTVKFDSWRNQFNNRVNSTYVRQRIESPPVTKRKRHDKCKVDVSKIIAEDTVWFKENDEVRSGTVVWVDPFTERLALQTEAQPQDSLCSSTIVRFNQLQPKPTENAVRTKRRPPASAPLRAKKRRVTDATAQTEDEPTPHASSGTMSTHVQNGKSRSRQFTLLWKKTSQEALNRAVDSSIRNAGDRAYQSLLRKTSIGVCIRREKDSLSKNGRRKTFKIGPVQLGFDKELFGMNDTFYRKFHISTGGDYPTLDNIAGAQWDVRLPDTTDTSAHYLVITSACFHLDKAKCP